MRNYTIMNPNPEVLRILRKKVARFNKEIATFEKKWPEILKNGDPYYNPNLTLKSQDFSLEKNLKMKLL